MFDQIKIINNYLHISYLHIYFILFIYLLNLLFYYCFINLEFPDKLRSLLVVCLIFRILLYCPQNVFITTQTPYANNKRKYDTKGIIEEIISIILHYYNFKLLLLFNYFNFFIALLDCLDCQDCQIALLTY